MRSLLVALPLLAACHLTPQLGYVDSHAPGVQVVDPTLPQLHGMISSPLRVPVDGSLSDDDAAAIFLRAAASHGATLATDLVVRRTRVTGTSLASCAIALAPTSQVTTEPEQVATQVDDSTEVPVEKCDTVQVPVDSTSTTCDTEGNCTPTTTTMFESQEDCHTEYETQTSSHTEWTTEDVQVTTWSLSAKPEACTPAPAGGPSGAGAIVEGTIYAAPR